MRIILNDCEPDEILALRAAKTHADMKPGQLIGVAYENGSYFVVRRNKASISVWKPE